MRFAQVATALLRPGHAKISARQSLRVQLPMVISALLVGAVTTFLWGAHWEMEATLVRAGGERARAAAGQIANLMGPGSHASMQKWRVAAGDQDVRKYVRDSRDDTSKGMRAHLLALVEGTGAWSVEVWSAGGSRLLEISTPLAEAPNAPAVVLPPLTGPPALGFNAFQALRGVVFHDSAVEIVDTPAEGMPAPLGPLGYLVFRSILTVNPPGALNRLVGGDAVIQIGNTAGGAWTDLSAIVPPPPVDFTASETETAEYRTREGDRRVGGIAIVAGTPWAVWVEFPRALLVAPAHTFLRRMIGFALIVVGIGGMLVRNVSSRITRPLHALAHAADDIAAGEYSRTINVTRSDEIGRAARAFNAMAADVRDSHQQLEARVLERTQALEALGASEAHYRTIVEVALDCIITIDADGNVVEFNPAAERTFGYEKQDVVGRELTELIVPVSGRADHRINIARFLATGGRSPVGRRLEMTVTKRDGSEFPVEMALSAVRSNRPSREQPGVVQPSRSHAYDPAMTIQEAGDRLTRAVIVFRDVSTERSLTANLARLAQYDVLTNLPNRSLFDDRLAQAATLARRTGNRVAVLFVDMDRLKDINDSLGHAIGDALLQSVAARLLACVRASDTVSRRGGDEFVLLLVELERPDTPALVAGKILAAIAEPHQVGEHVLHVTASIGIGTFPDDASAPEGLIQAADAAMYHAKEGGRSTFQFFTPEMNVRLVRRRQIERGIREALAKGQFVLHYQPIIHLATSAIVGVEALVRWQHPSRGLLAPAEFITVAEECGLILPLGRWVLGEACRQARAWQDEGLRPRSMAVNVSAIEFRSPGFVDNLAAVLLETGLDPQYLELEVTESGLMARAEATIAVLHRLKGLGVRLAVDDFGTGYSSLSYLSRFPIDTLKIDRSFVQGMTTGGHDAAIIQAIIGMGRSLQQCVVAEGIENAEQLAMLKGYLCAEGQGYHFSRPVAALELAELLRNDHLEASELIAEAP